MTTIKSKSSKSATVICRALNLDISNPRSFAATCMGSYGQDPTCQDAVPALSHEISSLEIFAFSLNIHSAVGDLQMLPRQTNRTDFITFLIPFSGCANGTVFCLSYPDLQLSQCLSHLLFQKEGLPRLFFPFRKAL